MALNTFGGYPERADRGLACRPDRHSELLACLPTLLAIARATGCRMFNCPYGQYIDGVETELQARAAVEVITELSAPNRACRWDPLAGADVPRLRRALSPT